MSAAVPGVGDKFMAMFALVPHATVTKFYLWNIFTAGYIEVFVPNLLICVPPLWSLGALVEPVWGRSECVRFLVVVNSGAGLITFVILFALYFATQSTDYV